MLRVMILAILFFLVSATSAGAQSASNIGDHGEQLGIGARIGGALAFVHSAVRSRLPSPAMHQAINGAAAPAGPGSMMALFDSRDEKPGLTVPVADSVFLGVGYQYLREEDVRLEVAETGSLDETYSSHNVVVRAGWQF